MYELWLLRKNFIYCNFKLLSCAHAVFDTESAEKMQKVVQRLQRVRDTQAQASLLYGQMDSDIMSLNKTIQKIKTINIEV